ncbi:hypothetical protein D3C75_1174220 [compost metagenome]
MGIDIATQATLTQRASARRVQVDDYPVRGFNPSPQHEDACLTLGHAALVLPDDLGTAIEQNHAAVGGVNIPGCVARGHAGHG